jgi:iron complex outermembrane receptor protein
MMFQNSVVKLSLSGYITTGFDFLYYIETGESMGRRPIVQKQNITGVNVIGSEFSLEYKISRHFDLNTNIAFNSSTISRYPDHPELEGKILTYTPELMANLGITYTGRYLNASANAKYTGEQYLDDANTMEIPGVVLLNMKLWYDFRFGLHLAVSGENLLDQRYLVYYDQLSVGRFISATVGFRF